MVLRVDRLIYIYMALCASLLLFNLIYTGRRRVGDIQTPRRRKWWTAYLEMSISEKEGMQLREKNKLARRLGRISELLNFEEVVEMMRREGNSGTIDIWFQRNRSVFVKIGSKYLKKRVMEKAYYAYVVCQNRLCGNTEQDAVVRYMLRLAGENSIYCRENALQAIYSSGNPELVTKAYKIMERYQIQHSQKLVTDGLVSFLGDKKELAECIWAQWDNFSPYYQTAFVNFMRLSAEGLGERLLPLLSEETDKEVQFAVLRYLRKNFCAKASTVLRRIVKDWKINDWEITALAASALENYPSRKTAAALYEGMHSTSWHVRNNASDALIKIGKEQKMMEKIMRESDKYAREMLQYKLERRKEECRNDGCN